MQEIKLCELENWIEEKAPCIVVGEPCESLYALQQTGVAVLAELRHLQGLPDDEVAEALCREAAVQQYKHVCIHAALLPQAYLRRVWCQMQNIPVLIAETECLVIRESVIEDAAAFEELYRDAACRKYLELPPVEDYQQYIRDYQNGQYAFWEYGMWTLIEKESGTIVGRAGLENQEIEGEGKELLLGLGYAILPQFRGRGYAVEACRAILEYCRECEYADRVIVRVHKENLASRVVFERLQPSACLPLILKQIES